MARTVKNPPAVWETCVQSLGWESPLEEDMTTHSSILAWRIPKDRGPWRGTVHGVAKSLDTTERLSIQGESGGWKSQCDEKGPEQREQDEEDRQTPQVCPRRNLFLPDWLFLFWEKSWKKFFILKPKLQNSKTFTKLLLPARAGYLRLLRKHLNSRD